MIKNEILIPKKKVMEMTSLSATTIWREINADRFPRSIKIGRHRVAWCRSDIEAWIQSKIEGDAQ